MLVLWSWGNCGVDQEERFSMFRFSYFSSLFGCFVVSGLHYGNSCILPVRMERWKDGRMEEYCI